MAVATTTILAAAAVASAVGTGVAVYGQKQAADAAEATGNYNAKIQRQQATQEGQVAAENARRKAAENARIIGAQRAALAQSGLAMEGTPLAVLGETNDMLELELMDLGYDASQRSRSLIAGASMSAWQGAAGASAARTAAAGTAIGGIASAGMSYADAGGYLAPKTN